MLALSDAANKAGELWTSALLLSLVGMVEASLEGLAVAASTFDRVATLCEGIRKGIASDGSSNVLLPHADDLNRFHFKALMNIVTTWNMDWWTKWHTRLEEIGNTEVMRSDVRSRYQLRLVNGVHPANLFGNIELAATSALQMIHECNINRLNTDLPENIRKMWFGAVYGISTCANDYMWVQDNFDWDKVYGANGQLLVDSFNAYSFEDNHESYQQIMSVDWQSSGCASAIPLIFHYGRFTEANEMIMASMGTYRKCHEDYMPEDGFNQLLGSGMLSQVLYLLGQTEFIHEFYSDIFGSLVSCA